MYQSTLDICINIFLQSTSCILESSSTFPSAFNTNFSYQFHIFFSHLSQLISHATFCLKCSTSLSTSQLCFKISLFFVLSVVSRINYLYLYRITFKNTTPVSNGTRSGHAKCQHAMLTHKALSIEGRK